MSFALFAATARKNWVLLIIFFGVLTMYTTIMITMFNPEDMDAITAMLDLFPKDLMKAMGFSQLVTDLTSYLASWLYGLLMFGFPMVYCIILGNRLVAKKVDNSSMACILATPHSRGKIIFTLGAYALFTVALLFAGLFGVGVLFGEILHPGLLDIPSFLRLNVTTMLVNMVVIMISFLASCIFNDSSLSIGFGAGIPIAFLMMNMLGGASENLSVIKEISPYGWYDPLELVKGEPVLWQNLAYAGIAAILFTAALLIFRRRRLPL